MSESPKLENLNIQLSDIIEIEAPTNNILNNKIFLVKYIDNEKLILINKDQPPIILTLKENGELDDESITAFIILSRDQNEGYAKQNKLIPGTWVDIYFSGDIPLVVTGLITNLEEDMIELKTYPEEEIIYIDFAYKGLPELLSIEKIIIRSSPEIKEKDEIAIDPTQQFDAIEDSDLLSLEPIETVAINKELIIAADKIKIGRNLEEITQIIEVPESEQRFGIEKQANDMLNELLASIPNAQRTQTTLNHIHKLIERYKQLREIFSTFDENNNALKPKIKGANYKPLVDILKNFTTKLYWILPVVKNSKKVYDIINDEDTLYITEQTLAETLIEENELTNNWKGNVIPEEQNKYNYYMRELNKLYTPFTNYDISNYIISIPTHTNLTTIIDTLSNQYSYVAKNDSIKQERFITQIYNIGLDRLESQYTQDRKIYNKIIKLTNDDTLLLKSFLTLPIGVYRFSHVNLPGTNIMDKSNLSKNFINYWELLKKSTIVNQVIIDNLETPIEFTPDNYLNNIKEFMLDETIERGVDTYEKYLNAFIPKTKIIFELVQKYIKNKLSFYQILNSLEPFMIYSRDISFKQYEEIVNFLNYKIIEFKKQFILNSKNFQALYTKLYGRPAKIENDVYVIFNILSSNKEIQTQVLSSYNITETSKMIMSNQEILNKMIRIDYGKLFMSALSKITLDLMVSDVFEKFLKIEENVDKKSANECSKYILSKKYLALDELEYDNHKIIYFDKKYDHTFYDIIKEYEKERASLPPHEFKVFLVNKLKENIGISEKEALRDTNAMLENKREVLSGDYALLEQDNGKGTIYRREKNVWIKDENLLDNVFFDNNKLFCESQFKCYESDNLCLDTASIERDIQKKNLKEIIGEFDEQYRLDLQKIKKKIDNNYGYNLERIGKIIRVEKEKKLVYNQLYQKLANEIEEEDIFFSPYEQLRDAILGQSDFIKKQNDIIKFATKYTRKPYSNEDQYWLYCIKTDLKLLPLFLLRLANTYGKRENYLKELDIICAEQGTISDDGNTWVDKYSGYVIRNIEYDTEEGYTEQGYKLQTRSILEEDLGSIILQKVSKVPKKEKPELDSVSKTILNIILTLTENMEINVDSEVDFVMKNVLAIQKTKVSSKEEYDKLVDKIEKSGKKKPPSYEDAFNSSLLILTFVYLLVAIQASIPSIKTNKTFPGCIKSFQGYPMEGSIDRSGLIYIACVAHKVKSSIKPWNSILKMKETTIIKNMELIIETYILENKEVSDLFKLKNQFLQLKESDIIPDTLDIKNWFTFLPPLVRFNIKSLTSIGPNFKSELLENIKRGSSKSQENLLTLASKIILFSLSIQENIQKVVNKEHPLLTTANGDPFLENACCNSSQNTLLYFIEKEKSIIQENDIVVYLGNLLYDINRMAYAAIYYDPENTKFIYPSLGVDFTDETIYKSFIYYCRFNSNLPISEELRGICLEKPANFEVSDSLESKINKLKADGKNYTLAAFDQLILYISRNNIVDINFNYTLVSNIDTLRHILLALEESDSQVIPAQFRDKFLSLIDTYSFALTSDTDTMRDFKNYLAKQNNLMYTRIHEFVKRHSKLAKTKFARFKTCLEEIALFSELDPDLNINKSILFIKTNIKNLISVFPNIVLNQIDYTNIAIPKHWKLSEKHNGDIKNIISEYYKGFKKLYDDPQTNLVFEKIQLLCQQILLLSNNTFYIPPIINQGTEYYSIFDKKLTLLLFNYYFYSILTEYLNLVHNQEVLINIDIDEETETFLDTVEEEIEEETAREEIRSREFDIVSGEKKELATKISSIIETFISIICNSKMVHGKQLVDFDYETIMDHVLKSKEKEKTSITDFLRDLTDEEREIENLFKNNKLERWSKGLQKGLTQYVKETYDDERDKLEEVVELEKKINKNDFVTSMNADIYKLDYEEEAAREEEINREEYDLGDLAEDDDYGDGDGDEGYA